MPSNNRSSTSFKGKRIKNCGKGPSNTNTEFNFPYSQIDDNRGVIIPFAYRCRLYELFHQIEKEFVSLYTENIARLKYSKVNQIKEKYKNNFPKGADKRKKLGEKKESFYEDVKQFTKILNANPSLVASASNRKVLKPKRMNKVPKEEKSTENGMKVQHQKMNSSDRVSGAVDLDSPVKSEGTAPHKKVSVKSSASSTLSENDNSTVTPPCLTPAAEIDDSGEQQSMPVDPLCLRAYVLVSRIDSEINNRGSIPRRAKRPAPAPPLRKPPKKRCPKVNENSSSTAETTAELLIPEEKARVVSPECASVALPSNINVEDVAILPERNLVVSENRVLAKKPELSAAVELPSSSNELLAELLALINPIDQTDLSEESTPLNELVFESIPRIEETSSNPIESVIYDSTCESRADGDSEMRDCSSKLVSQTSTLNDETFVENNVEKHISDQKSNSVQDQTTKSEQNGDLSNDRVNSLQSIDCCFLVNSDGDTTVDCCDKVAKLTKKEKLIACYFVKIAKHDFTTGPVTLEKIAVVAKTTKDSAKTIADNICKKGLVERLDRQAEMSNYRLSRESVRSIKNILDKDLLDLLNKEITAAKSLDIDYICRDKVAKLTGHKRLIACHLVEIVKDNLVAGPVSIQELANVAQTTTKTITKVIQQLVNEKFIVRDYTEPQSSGNCSFKLAKKFINSVKSIG